MASIGQNDIGRIYTRISSQLPQYRVTVMFGMLPPSIELYHSKICWEATLVHKGRMSRLKLFNHKGTATVRFI